MRKQSLRLIAVLAVFCGIASASCAVGQQAASYMDVCGVDAFDDCGDATMFVGVSLLFVSLAIALAYMFGKLKEDPSLVVWAKDEGFNTLITVFLFVGLLAFFNASCAVSESYAKKNPFDSADYYLDRLIGANGLNVLRTLTYDSLSNQLDATAFIFISIAPYSGTGSAYLAGLKARSAHKEFVMDLYIPILASLNAQKYLLQTLRWVGAAILLPFAFVLRIIPPTRDFGNTMIAIFFATYIVVPLLYSLSGQAFERITASPRCEYSDASGRCTVHNFYSLGIDGTEGNSGEAVRGAIFYKIGSTIPQAIFLPNLVMIVAITCAMSLSKALRAIAV